MAGLGKYLAGSHTNVRASQPSTERHEPPPPQRIDPIQSFGERARISLVESIGASFGESAIDQNELRNRVVEELQRLIDVENLPLSEDERQQVVQDVTNDVLGYGPIETLLQDPSITEVMVNGTDSIYVERAGQLVLTSSNFRSEAHLRRVIEKIVSSIGRRIDETSPMVDARLADGSRVNAIISPLAVDGPSLTIRKFAKDGLQASDLIANKSLTVQSLEFLQAAIEGQLNIIVSGGTGTGKTTFLNVLSSYIPSTDRIVTIEDAVELRLRQRHVIRLECRPPNIEGKGSIGSRELLRNSLRMRPDRIIVGECRGGEALDMLQAMNTGHDGSLTTLHANSPRDALSRIETMVLMAGFDLPTKAIREQIGSAVDLLVQLERLRTGARVVTSIAEVVGLEGSQITLNEIYKLDFGTDMSSTPLLLATGVTPQNADKLAKNGVTLNPSMFVNQDDRIDRPSNRRRI